MVKIWALLLFPATKNFIYLTTFYLIMSTICWKSVFCTLKFTFFLTLKLFVPCLFVLFSKLTYKRKITTFILLPWFIQGKSIYQGPDKSWEFIRYKRMFSTTFETGKLEFPLEFKRRTELHMEMTEYVLSVYVVRDEK